MVMNVLDRTLLALFARDDPERHGLMFIAIKRRLEKAGVTRTDETIRAHLRALAKSGELVVMPPLETQRQTAWRLP